MKRRLFTLFVAFVVIMVCRAGVVTADRALAVAREFVNHGSAKLKAGAPLKLAYQARSVDGKPDYYVFNNGDNGGFIVVSGDDRTVPVWGYSTSGTFDYESMPDNAKWWYGEYQRQLQYLRDNPKAKARKPVKLTTSVGPLLTTKWDQYQPYNNSCPVAIDNLSTGYVYTASIDGDEIPIYYFHKACTGCVATALAQIMNYHKWPKVGTGYKEYTSLVKSFKSIGSEEEMDRSVKLSADFSKSTYRWSDMKNLYKSTMEDGNIFFWYMDNNGHWVKNNDSGYAVAKLMSDVGIAVEMQYGAPGRDGSEASITDAETAMRTYFFYNTELVGRDDYNSADWDELLRNQLDLHHPIYYRGSRAIEDAQQQMSYNGGHAFVFDGYNDQGMFHINWGWSGEDNAYYISSLNDKTAKDKEVDYQYWQAALFLEPNRTGKSFSAVMSKTNYGNVNKNSQTSSSLSVYGQNLDQDVSISLSGAGASMYSTVSAVTASEANAEGGKTVKVTYHPTATGEHAAQLTVSTGDRSEPITFILIGNSCVNYDANGDESADVADVVAAINAVLNEDELNFDDNPDISTIVAMINAIINDETNIDLDDGLVAYYPFNGDAHDASGHGNDGEVHDLWSAGGVNGDTNGAWHFGGYNHPGYIRIPNSESLQFTDGFTFACYVKPLDWSGMDGNGNYSNRGKHCIFAKDHNLNGPTLSMELNDNVDMQVNSSSFVDSWCSLSSGDKISSNKLNEWVHVAVTYSKTKSRLFINGLLVDERDINADFSRMNSHDLYLGKFSDNWYPFRGVMDEVRVYNRALNSSEVRDLADDNLEIQEQKHPFKLSEKAVTLAVGETVKVYMINGTGSYSMGSTTSIVDFKLDREGEFFTLTGTGAGNTNVTVTDVNTQTTIYLPVTVTDQQYETFTVNGVTFKMVAVEGGTFTMGSEAEDADAYNWEKPAHQVTLSSYSIGETEVTQALWQAVMGSNPSRFTPTNGFTENLNRPVECVSWDDCQTFISKLNELTGKQFRLPTEAEWEYAARGGKNSQGYKYAGSNDIDEVAWYWNNIPSQSSGTNGYGTQPVATKKANELGLYDMSGNVWEWCHDWYGSYSKKAQTNPTGPSSGDGRVNRGGGWGYGARDCRVPCRDYYWPTDAISDIGLRLAL